MTATEVCWSEFRDWEAGHATVREAVERSEHREAFMGELARFTARANRHEQVSVCWWHAPFIYVEVRDDRYHYPCNVRASATFHLGDGEWSTAGAVFARKGWGAFMDDLYRHHVSRYKQCPEPARPKFCLIPSSTARPAAAVEHSSLLVTAK